MIPLHDDNPTENKPYITVSFIAVCIVVYLWQLSLGAGQEGAMYALGVTPAVLLGSLELSPHIERVPSILTPITSMFLHGGFMHLGGNMLYLWIFGNNIEDAMGRIRFVVFYVLCGVAAVFAQVLQNPQSDIPMIGASGAISGVLGAYVLLYPHARVLVLIPLGFFLHTMRLKASIVLALWFGLQIMNSLLSGSGPGVAWFAHIGGFIAGLAFVALFKRNDIKLFNPPLATPSGSTESVISRIRRPGPGAWEKPETRVETNCPHCHGRLRLPAGRSGIVDCPLCNKAFETST